MDENADLEAYIYIPTERAANIRMGLPVQIVSNSGELIESTKIYFISQQVDNATQGILVKAPIHALARQVPQRATGEGARDLEHGADADGAGAGGDAHRRPGVRLSWRCRTDNGTVAKQRAVTLGDTIGNDYAVLGGLKPGDKVIISGTQFLIDGAPVQPISYDQPKHCKRSRMRDSCSRKRKCTVWLIFSSSGPIFATVCALLIILAGAVSIPTLPISLYPDLAPPQVTVTSNYVGANAQVVESAVTIPLEQQINGVEGMHYITSTSSNDGTSNINVTFRTGYDLNIAAVDVQNRVATAQGRLPQEIKNTGVTITKANPNFVFAAGFYSPDNSLSNQYISNYLDVYVKDALKRIPGVGDVIIFGERKYAMRIWLDPTKLAARQLTAADVVRRSAGAERRNSRRASWAGRRADPKQDFQITLRVVGRLSRAEGVREHHPEEHAQRHRAAEGCGPRGDRRGKLRHEPAVQRPRRHRHRRAAALERQRARRGQGGQGGAGRAVEIVSSGNEVRRSLSIRRRSSATRSRKWSPRWKKPIVIVIVVIFFFLLDWRATIIPAVTIPVSLIGTFAFIKIFRFLDQFADLVRHHAGHRPGGRRRHRGHRKRAAPHQRRHTPIRTRRLPWPWRKSPARWSLLRWC